MNTFVLTLVYLAIVIICYYLNKKLIISGPGYKNIWSWEYVGVNLFFSIIILPSIMVWIYYIKFKLLEFPDKPPRWL
jgi:hypothetical protein